MKQYKIFLLALLFIGLTGLFTLNFTRNVFNLGVTHDAQQWRPNDFVTFQQDATQSIVLMLEKTKRDGLLSTGGFMMQPQLDGPIVYTSAWGLHAKIFSYCYFFSNDPVPVFMVKAENVVALLFGLLMAAFTVFVLHELGWGAALALVVGLNWSDWLIFAARNTSYVYFRFLLPMVLAWVLYPRFQRPQGFNWTGYLAVVGGAVLAHALCTVDYISNVVLSTATAPIYYGFRDALPLRRIARGVIAIVLVSAAAVALAILATGVQASLWRGSLTDGFGPLFIAYSSRMYGATDMARAAPTGVSVFAILEQYLTIPALTLPWLSKAGYHVFLSFFAFIIISLPACLVAFLDGRLFPCIEKERNKLIGLSAATVWGLLATLSWAFMAKGHMSHHFHCNGVIFYLPYMLLLYVLLGKIAAVAVRQIAVFIRTRQWPTFEPVSQIHAATIPAGKNKKKRQ